MSHGSDREDSSFPLLESGKAEKLTSPAFHVNGKSSEKLEKLTGFPREDLFRGVGKAHCKAGVCLPEKQSTFSRVWEKLKSGSKPPRQTPGRSGHGTTEFGLKLPREILEIEEKNVF